MHKNGVKKHTSSLKVNSFWKGNQNFLVSNTLLEATEWNPNMTNPIYDKLTTIVFCNLRSDATDAIAWKIKETLKTIISYWIEKY